MTTAHVVIGMNYGDEGKGLMTDYLINKFGGSVVRFNGSAQAGHTVVTPDGDRHVFHHLGSGTFLGAPTILGGGFLVHPMLYREEYESLRGYKPVVSCMPDCQVITPFDVLLNQARETARGGIAHGSCGVGVYEAIKRGQDATFGALRVRHLHNWSRAALIRKLWYCREYASAEIQRDGLPVPIMLLEHSEQIIQRFADDCQFFVDTLSPTKIPDHIVFEGAQGLLLDQDYGTMPYCTPTSCGLRHVAEELLSYEQVEVIYVTRSYLTRHGNGPLPGEKDLGLTDKTNVDHAYQGSFRYAPLRYHGPYTLDYQRYTGTSNTTCAIAVTHLDEYDDGLWEKHFFAKYMSFGETREDAHVSVN